MSVAAQVQAPSLPSGGRLIVTLGGIAMISGLLVVLAFQLTAPRIARNKREALERAVFTVLPGAAVRSNFFVDVSGLMPLPPEDISGANIYAGYDAAGGLVGLAMEASARGYQDVVRLLYGYAPDRECVIGITVLQSTETPGLGDKVSSDPNFLANFDCLEARLNAAGTALENEITTVKNGQKTQPWQIDGIAGATVTSTAVGKALRDSTNEMLPLIQEFAAGRIPGFQSAWAPSGPEGEGIAAAGDSPHPGRPMVGQPRIPAPGRGAGISRTAYRISLRRRGTMTAGYENPSRTGRPAEPEPSGVIPET